MLFGKYCDEHIQIIIISYCFNLNSLIIFISLIKFAV